MIGSSSSVQYQSLFVVIYANTHAQNHHLPNCQRGCLSILIHFIRFYFFRLYFFFQLIRDYAAQSMSNREYSTKNTQFITCDQTVRMAVEFIRFGEPIIFCLVFYLFHLK